MLGSVCTVVDRRLMCVLGVVCVLHVVGMMSCTFYSSIHRCDAWDSD